MQDLMDYRLTTGVGKTNKNWYMLTVTIGKYSSEPLFVSELEYEYLKGLNQGDGKINLEEE